MTLGERILKSNNKSKTIWDIINELLGKQQTTHDIQKLTIDGNNLTNQQSIEDAFNKYFSSIVDKTNTHSTGIKNHGKLSADNYLVQQVGDSLSPLVFKPTSTREIISIIKSLSTKNSFGYEEISTKILKISTNFICSPLTYIFNKSVYTGIFPERLKYSIVKPFHKKGTKTDPTNYRPISMLTAFSKVLEKVLYNRLLDYLNSNNLLNSQQFRFRKRLSTDDAIFKLTQEILNALNNKVMMGSIFFDLAKAFDSVNHSLLINKLPYYGIMGKAKLLIESYLANRFQRFQLDSTILKVKTTSAWSKVNQGVPQGSVLGPLLFLLYINDLPNAVSLNATPILFTDDTSIIITGQNVLRFQEELNATFGNISKWFQANSLSLNISKTHFTQFFSKNTNYYDTHVSYENNCISKVNETKFLGININNTLSWKTHIEEMLPKLCSACFAMKSVKPLASQQILKIIYYSYFHSIMSYGVIFWGHSSLGIKVFRLQKRIIRIMTGSRNRDSCSKLFTSMEILPLPSLYIFLLLRFVMKNKDLFTTNNKFHNLCT